MAVKTITITEGAYRALKAKKGEKDSFSDVIIKMTGKRPLSDFYGALSRESAERLERAVKEARDAHRKLHSARIKRIKEELK